MDPAPPNTVFHDRETAEEEVRDADGRVAREAFPGFTTTYIPVQMSDNRYTPANYAAQFRGLSPELAKALVDGDWDTVVGAALHNLSRDRHCLPDFRWSPLMDELRHCTVFVNMDWGTERPFYVAWFLVTDQPLEFKSRETGRVRFVPEDSVVISAEWAGCDPDDDNKGLRMPSEAVARGILNREEKMGIEVDYRVAASQMWAQSDGPSPQEKMAKRGVFLRQGVKDRQRNYEEVLSRLAGNPRLLDRVEADHHPTFYVTENCTYFWRTAPALVLDETDPDKGPTKEKRQPDYAYDAVAYGLRSRPFSITAEERREQE